MLLKRIGKAIAKDVLVQVTVPVISKGIDRIETSNLKKQQKRIQKKEAKFADVPHIRIKQVSGDKNNNSSTCTYKVKNKNGNQLFSVKIGKKVCRIYSDYNVEPEIVINMTKNFLGNKVFYCINDTEKVEYKNTPYEYNQMYLFEKTGIKMVISSFDGKGKIIASNNAEIATVQFFNSEYWIAYNDAFPVMLFVIATVIPLMHA